MEESFSPRRVKGNGLLEGEKTTLTSNENRVTPPPHTRRAVWYTISGLLFILTGIFAFFQVSIGAAGSLLLVFAGVLVILLRALRYHPTPDALAIFIISLLVFGLFSSGAFTFNMQSRTYNFTRTQYPSVSKLGLSLSESFGSIDVSFVNDPNTLVNLTYATGPLFFGSFDLPLVTHSSAGGNIMVSGTGGVSSLTVVIGSVEVTSLNASANTASISIRVLDTSKLTSLDARTSTGSISIELVTRTLTLLRAGTSTGSINIDAQYRSLPRNATLSATANTGSVNLILNTNLLIGVDLSAKTNLGSVSEGSLSGYASPIIETNNQLRVQTPNYNSALHSLQASLTTSTGSVDVTAASG